MALVIGGRVDVDFDEADVLVEEMGLGPLRIDEDR
jgi:hypothetical protein